MTTRNSAFIRLALTTALATTALAGCSGKVAPTAANSAGKAEVALAKGKANQAVTHAEAAVLASPRDAYTRTLLGNAYLEAGRFASAATTFQDAIALGDGSPRTVVSLSLAQTGMGDRAAAIHTLESYETAIDPADFGLAISLAGQPQRGVHVLSNALRAGNNTAKVRQNLAYAYAMSGQWREARLMVAEDVSADKVGERMAEWGAMAHPEHYRTRIAALLEVDIVSDPGQPTMLALSNNPNVEMLASENVEPVAEEMPEAQFAYAQELPAIRPAAIERIDLEDQQALVPQPTGSNSERSEHASLPADRVTSRQVATTKVVAPAPAARKTSKPAPSVSLARGDYNIQLGSYFSMQDAEAGWNKFQAMYPELGDAERVISRARVNGKIYYRVAAVGYAKDSARALCSTVKGKGGGCIAYASSNPLPGALGNGSMRVAAR